MRNGYLQGQWQRVQMFLVFNTVALPLIFGTVQPEQVKLIICVVGLGIHMVILQATLRADGWIQFLDARMINLEQLDDEDPSGVRVKVFSHPDFAGKRYSWLASRKAFGFFGLAVSAVWVWQSIHYFRLLF